jgi:hypothetical protein
MRRIWTFLLLAGCAAPPSTATWKSTRIPDPIVLLMARLDRDHSGTLDESEVLTRSPHESFVVADTNHDGAISLSELRTAIDAGWQLPENNTAPEGQPGGPPGSQGRPKPGAPPSAPVRNPASGG